MVRVMEVEVAPGMEVVVEDQEEVAEAVVVEMVVVEVVLVQGRT